MPIYALLQRTGIFRHFHAVAQIFRNRDTLVMIRSGSLGDRDAQFHRGYRRLGRMYILFRETTLTVHR